MDSWMDSLSLGVLRKEVTYRSNEVGAESPRLAEPSLYEDLSRQRNSLQ